MTKCASCKWWVAMQEHEISPKNNYDADGNSIEFDVEVRRCKSPMLLKFQHPMQPNEATVLDGSHYHAGLYTGPEFGCVNHEPCL